MKYLSMSAFKGVDYAPIKDGTKTVTRRLNCNFEVGNIVCVVERMRGLKQGGHYKKLAYIRITGITQEALTDMNAYTNPLVLTMDLKEVLKIEKKELKLEGFPHLAGIEFINMFCKLNHCKPDVMVYRIEFEYLTDDEAMDYLAVIEGRSKLLGLNWTNKAIDNTKHFIEINKENDKNLFKPNELRDKYFREG